MFEFLSTHLHSIRARQQLEIMDSSGAVHCTKLVLAGEMRQTRGIQAYYRQLGGGALGAAPDGTDAAGEVTRALKRLAKLTRRMKQVAHPQSSIVSSRLAASKLPCPPLT